MADDARISLQGQILTATVKDEYRNYTACGACSGRLLQWRFRLGPDTIQDLGKTPVIPQLDVVDALFGRLWDGKPAADLASPQVIAALEPFVADQRRFQASRKSPMRSLGLLESSGIVRHREDAELCLVLADFQPPSLQEYDRQFVFDARDSHGKYFLDSVNISDGADPMRCRRLDQPPS